MPTTSTLEELKAEFRLSYHLDALHACHELVGLAGRDVLEVGGSLPDELVRGHYGARTWYAIDDATRYRSFASRAGELTATAEPTPIEAAGWEPGSRAQLDGRIQDMAPELQGRFDLIFSIATLEHVGNLPGALRTMRTALRPGGSMYLLVGPIWSSYRGYHIYPDYFPESGDRTRRLLETLRPWQHLAQNRPEMHASLRAEFGEEFAEVVTASMYESTRLNHLFAEEYFMLFQSQGLHVKHLVPWATGPEVDRSLLPEVRRRHPCFTRFEWDGFNCLLERPPGS